MRITRRALNASESSILLSEEKGQKLIFAFADGSSGEVIKRLKISKNSGIAGWVASHGEPLIVNDVYKNKFFNQFTDTVTGHATKSLICAPLVIGGKVIGVIEVLNKLNSSDFDEHDLHTLSETAATVVQVIENIRRTESGKIANKSAVNALLSAINAKDTLATGHARRVSEYAMMGATGLLPARDGKQIIEYAAVLHDIGKLGVPDSTLSKSDNPSIEEQATIRKHPIIGFNMLKGIEFLEEASKSILYHHETYDGKGYPKGLKQEVIPIGARLIAVADAFDHLTADQSQHLPLSKKDALTELHKDAGSKFDPAVVKAFDSGFVSSLR